MRAIAATIVALHAVQLSFSGNALTPYVKGYPPPTQAHYDKCRRDATAAIAIFAPHGAHVFLVGAPINRSEAQTDPNWDRLNHVYAQLAAQDPEHVTYVAAARLSRGRVTPSCRRSRACSWSRAADRRSTGCRQIPSARPTASTPAPSSPERPPAWSAAARSTPRGRTDSPTTWCQPSPLPWVHHGLHDHGPLRRPPAAPRLRRSGRPRGRIPRPCEAVFDGSRAALHRTPCSPAPPEDPIHLRVPVPSR